MKVIVSNIQRFCMHDGPGIRTTVFFKGCNLRCPWCANPENIEFNLQEYENDGEMLVFGKEMTLNQIEKEILKDIQYFENGGGVTFSGGEPLLQFEKIEPFLRSLKGKNINICVETALSVPIDFVNIAIKYVDEFIIDIKILDEENIAKINGNLKLYLRNINEIFKNHKKVIFRIPLAKEYIVTEKNISLILEFLKEYKPYKVEIFKIHNLAEKKYKSLNKKMEVLKEISDQEIEGIKNRIEELEISVEICKI